MNGAGSTSKFAISSTVRPPEALVPDGRAISSSNGGVSSPALQWVKMLGFSTGYCVLGVKHC
jgi:hypothetical protein